jgi:hypothetical protein
MTTDLPRAERQDGDHRRPFAEQCGGLGQVTDQAVVLDLD